jgi:hypothetical protein
VNIKTTPDGSAIDEANRIVYFSVERFVADVCNGNRCFICGAYPAVTQFNDEHVLPDWILRKYNLHAKSITLPNGTTFRYGHEMGTW